MVLDVVDERGVRQILDAKQTVAFVIFSDGSVARAKAIADGVSEHLSHWITCAGRDRAKADQFKKALA